LPDPQLLILEVCGGGVIESTSLKLKISASVFILWNILERPYDARSCSSVYLKIAIKFVGLPSATIGSRSRVFPPPPLKIDVNAKIGRLGIPILLTDNSLFLTFEIQLD